MTNTFARTISAASHKVTIYGARMGSVGVVDEYKAVFTELVGTVLISTHSNKSIIGTILSEGQSFVVETDA